MRPILLKGHERSITSLKYNREGDLIFTAGKNPTVVAWYTHNGERVGTYNGHNGAIWSVDVNRSSSLVLSGSADTYAKLWDAEYGKEQISWGHRAPVRTVSFAHGEKEFLAVTDQVLGYLPTVLVWDVRQKATKPIYEVVGRNENTKILHAQWGDLNKTVVTANEDGTVRIYDVRNGEQLKVINDSQKAVMHIAWNKKKTLFATACRDGNARLYDAKTYQLLKTYHTGRPVNGISISPNRDEIIVAGGQSADSVTTTRVDNAQFRVRFFHLIFEEELGSVQGHFGPVNVLAYSNDGKGFASGGEDGYVRLHHFDQSYFTKFGKEWQ